MIALNKLQRVLAFFAHPDDETLGAGASIAKLTELGAQVRVAIPATGITSRLATESPAQASALDALKRDTQQAMAVLGVSAQDIYFGNFRDNQLDDYPLLELIHWLEQIITDYQPELILTHHRFCTNIDHQRCHEAAVVATRPNGQQHIPILCAEVPSSTGYLRPTQWEPNVYVQVNAQQLEKKVAAMACYEGEARPDPHPRSPEVLRALAKVRGSDAGFHYAEAFMLQKAFA